MADNPRPSYLTESKGGSMPSPPSVVIEVFADIWCPFAHVGLRAIERQLAQADRTDAAIWVRAWPLELVNGAPLDPAVTREHAHDLREQVAPNLFQHLDVDRFPSSTLDALALANRAYRADFQAGERVSFALRDALFEEGRDISNPVTLECLAHDLDVVMPDESDNAGVLADWYEGRRRGVLGSPHFFCADADVFCPSLDIKNRGVEGVSIVNDISRLTEFLAGCLAQPGPR
jgi:predicted DsbA family dithiol-disulfide isomerase